MASPTSVPTQSVATTAVLASPAAIVVVQAATATPKGSATVIPAATAPPAEATSAPADGSPAPSTQPGEHGHVFPVRTEGKVSYGSSHHDYPAADIFCPRGSEFVAVTDGVVDFVSREDVWDPKVNDGATRGGLSVAIIGDDGVRYYGSHLSQVAEGIEPGTRVKIGQLLGLTGNTGDARVTAPHLHFGISHPTKPDDWEVRRGEIQPYAYLKDWQRGKNATPEFGDG